MTDGAAPNRQAGAFGNMSAPPPKVNHLVE
jgi:hypothetical protein